MIEPDVKSVPNDYTAITPSRKSQWLMVLIQISPLIIQLIGEAFLRAQGVPATLEIGSGPKPLFEVKSLER